MKNYVGEIEKMLKASGKEFDGLTVVNKEGIIEYSKNLRTLSPEMDVTMFRKDVVGKHILEAYSTLKEEDSTVMRTLKTGEMTTIDHQMLCSGDRTIVITGTTFPIFDEYGEIRGAVDAAKVVKYIDNSKSESIGASTALDRIITCSNEMIKLKETLEEVAESDSPVFLYGETGTGKELAAQALHQLSPRRQGPFIAQNCAAIPTELLESTFFGTEKGGFTGAEPKQGLFELANGGTLFLDEINSMGTIMQTKLLKALEEQNVRKIGGEREIRFDVRIVCASNEDPQELLQAERLRKDFYYRVSVVKIFLPPLRQRKEDIMLLTSHFISVYNEKMSKSIRGVSSMTEDLFLRWSWPGNVRELRSTIESAFNREKGSTITLNSVIDLLNRVEEQEVEVGNVSEQELLRRPSAGILPAELSGSDEMYELPMIREKLRGGKIDLQKLLEDYERSIIFEAIRLNPRLTAVADKLSMSPQKLNYRMNKLRIK